jgi:hypothetical protein
MHIAVCQIRLTAPYCQSRFHSEPKLSKELADDYERRTWRERLHVDDDGMIIIPGLAIANAVKEAAKFLSIQIPGKGKATWTKHFEAGISCVDDLVTGVKKDQAIEKQMFVPSNGVRGAGSRVMKSYPILLPPIETVAEFRILDDLITPETFAFHLQQAGLLIGLGAFRVRNNGVFGQFAVDDIEWHENAQSVVMPKITIVKSKKRAAA